MVSALVKYTEENMVEGRNSPNKSLLNVDTDLSVK